MIAGAEVAAYVALLKKRGRSLHTLRKLVRIVRDYPREPLLAAIRTATHYGLDDMDRFESLVLRHIAGDFFPLPAAEISGERGVGHEDDDDEDKTRGEPDGEGAEPEDDDDR